MVKITKIEIKNFRAFPKTYQIDLSQRGKNLLVYGENGSGKSSLYLALKLFLESEYYIPIRDYIKWDNPYDGWESIRRFEKHQNIFSEDDGYIKLHLQDQLEATEHIYEWSRTVKKPENQLMIDVSKTKGFLDYKTLLEMHHLYRGSATVNVFELLTRHILANTINDATNRSFTEDWEALQWRSRVRQGATKQVAGREEKIQNFNRGLASKLQELKAKASEILDKFRYNVDLDFDFQGITYNSTKNTRDNEQILLTVEFFDKIIPSHHYFLNEAKLSAISLSIYFAALLLQPASDLKILALDDVLIGLDMSNRLPVLDILREYFSDHQIFFMTYDRVLYEIVKQRTEEKDWKYAEFYFSSTDEYEMPVYAENKAYLEKAQEYLDANDSKACVIYLRTAFEKIIKDYCARKHLPVRYRRNPNKLNSQNFWDSIKAENNGTLERALIKDIELYRSIILNPLSHDDLSLESKNEIERAIKTVERLKDELKVVPINRTYLEKAWEYFNVSDYKACVIDLRTAFEKIIKDYCARKRLPVRYHKNPNKLNSQDFWDSIKTDHNKTLQQTLIKDIECYRSTILNPFIYADTFMKNKNEIEHAIKTVERLKDELN